MSFSHVILALLDAEAVHRTGEPGGYHDYYDTINNRVIRRLDFTRLLLLSTPYFKGVCDVPDSVGLENNAEANIGFVANNRVKPNDVMADSG